MSGFQINFDAAGSSVAVASQEPDLAIPLAPSAPEIVSPAPPVVQHEIIPHRSELLREFIKQHVDTLPNGSTMAEIRLVLELAWAKQFQRVEETETLRATINNRRNSFVGVSLKAIDSVMSDIRAQEMNERRAGRSHWLDQLQRSQQGVAISNSYNCGLAVEGVFGNGLRYDTFKDKVFVQLDTGGPEQVLDDDAHFRILTTIQQQGFAQAKKSDTQDAVYAIAKNNKSNSLTDRLNTLKWDRVERVETWMQRLLNAEDTPYLRRVGRLTLLQAVARAYNPGCKADHTTVLVGEQGVGKSSVWRELSYEQSIEFTADFTHKDGLQQMRGRWFVELAELSSLNRKEVEQVKAFLTKQEDNYRKSYGREDQEYKREFVLCGSSNPQPFLKDYTGSRRWFCVETRGFDVLDKDGKLKKKVNIPGLRSEREQLWAEAIEMYRHGLKSYCDDAWFTESQGVENEKWTEQDPWEVLIGEYIWNDWEHVNGKVAYTPRSEPRSKLENATYILQHVCGVETAQLNQINQNRVGKILLKRGYKSGTVRISGQVKQGYVLANSRDGVEDIEKNSRK
ncbi:VapE domain-containing protein [Rhizobium ruizarguesonis]|uniref:VapE domain-containing protein n=1 Tax=Rhizobium ruizarguesonis TaxID=2081791 RepID=UPI0013BD3B9A|nr:virulence-associated E family protein [Rhizobium ruizarguesonis]NEH64597.1 hypothetical protein [Rhizobium ruizarguesonis]NEH78089.1 hypothetical protein [Rhizobium ruizarguesonis]NEI78520.1 hypothetical protein [Rhizobium ruizarguesonis]